MQSEPGRFRRALVICQQLACVPEGLLRAFIAIVKQHSSTVFARQRHPGVEFGTAAYADALSSFESPNRVLSRSGLSSVRMGRHSYCSTDCRIAFSEIGRFCSIGSGVIIGPGRHPVDLVSTFPGFYSSREHTANFRYDDTIAEHAEVRIGNDVWIGDRVIVLPGIRIGHGAVVGAGAVVTRDVAPYEVVGGVPARRIRLRFDAQTVTRLLALSWWDWTDETIRMHAEEFVDPALLCEAR